MKQSNPFFNKNYAIEKFEEPWHAQLFALTINLNDNQIFSWSEWVAVFSRNLNRVEKCNESETGYFEIWLDSLEEIDPDMMYHREEYHGKEGKNGEWGEYIPSENDDWGDQGPCGGDWIDENEMHYIDEDVMWIGKDGDTIWE